MQVSQLVYLTVESLRRHANLRAIAADVSAAFGREVSSDNILYLIQNKLAPVGLLASSEPEAHAELPDGASHPRPGTSEPANLLALRFRIALVPERVHRSLTRALTPLFWPPVMVAALAILVAFDVWLVWTQADEVATAMARLLFEPRLFLLITALTVVAGAFHEMGHAAAARYGGATPGAMGAGVYLVWPVFYTDVSDTYRLGRGGRLRTDIGGVYFNVLFTLAAFWGFMASGFAPLLVLATLVQLETLRQFLPFVRLDGYYIVSDLAGVPNLFSYIQPVVTLLFRRRDAMARWSARQKLNELKPRARMIIMGWVGLTTPVLAFNLLLFMFLLPRLAGTALGAASYQIAGMTTPSGGITPVGVANGVVGLILLVLPVAGISYLLVKVLSSAGKFAIRWLPQRPALAGGLTGAAVLALIAQVGMFWPNTFASALSDAQLPGNGGRGLEMAYRMLPPGLSDFAVMAHRSPAATPVLLTLNDESEPTSLVTSAADGAVPAPAPAAEPPPGSDPLSDGSDAAGSSGAEAGPANGGGQTTSTTGYGPGSSPAHPDPGPAAAEHHWPSDPESTTTTTPPTTQPPQTVPPRPLEDVMEGLGDLLDGGR